MRNSVPECFAWLRELHVAGIDQKMTSSDTHKREESEWLDLKAIQRYACVSDRTLRQWIHRPIDALPAVRVGTKILIRRSSFDTWLEAHLIKQIDADTILNELFTKARTRTK